MTLTTSPLTRLPTGYFVATFSHGLGVFCLRPRAIFSFSWSMCRTLTSISSSILTISLRVVDAAPAHVGDVQQAVDAAQVDERAEVGDVLDDALADLADFELVEQLASSAARAGPRCSLRRLTTMLRRASSILRIMHSIVLADVVADVGRPADVDLAGRQEDVDADVDQQAALDLAGDLAGDDVAFVVLGDDALPVALPVRLAVRQDDLAGLVLHRLRAGPRPRRRAWGRLARRPTR